MQRDRLDAEAAVALGSYWKNLAPAAQYRILPGPGRRFASALVILLLTALGVVGIFAGFLGYVLWP